MVCLVLAVGCRFINLPRQWCWLLLFAFVFLCFPFVLVPIVVCPRLSRTDHRKSNSCLSSVISCFLSAFLWPIQADKPLSLVIEMRTITYQWPGASTPYTSVLLMSRPFCGLYRVRFDTKIKNRRSHWERFRFVRVHVRNQLVKGSSEQLFQ